MSGRAIGDRFELRELLGRGGMSEVWLAEDRNLGRLVALKLLAGGADPARLVREARSIATLSHPHIAAVYDVGETEGRPFLVLEYLPGGTLEERLEEGRPLPDADTERIAAQIAAGLDHAHANGIVHRDLKPSNVLFDAEGRAKLADFGIAQAAGQATLTEAGTVLGTAAYLSPEQAEGRAVGPAADVYSFGVILFRLLTGRLPFTGATPLEVALKHQREPAPPVQSIRPDAPAGLAVLAGHALSKRPENRPADGRELAGLLAEPATLVLPRRSTEDRTLVLDSPAARPTPQAPAGGSRRRVLAAAIAGLAILAGGGILAAVLLTGDDAEPPLTQPAPTTEPEAPTDEPEPVPEPEPTEPDGPTTDEATTEETTSEAPTDTAPTDVTDVTTEPG